MKKMLLIVDPQVDFITGTLPVPSAAEAMDALAEYVRAHGEDYSVKVVTSDWHPYHHSSFVPEGGQWPRHCVQHSAGAALWQSLLVALNETIDGFQMLYKGDTINREEYSILQNKRSARLLLELLVDHHIDQIDVCGLAGDVCVLNTCKDLKAMIGERQLHVLSELAPSLDGGKALNEFVKTLEA